MRRLATGAAVTLTTLGLAFGTLTVPAHAVPGPNGTSEVLAAVGSDTTVDVMGKLAKRYNKSNSGNPVPRDKVKNVPPILPPGGSYAVPGDAVCGPVTYSNPGNPPPNGSSSGISALVADSTGCIDLARSSRGRSPSDPVSLDFYAYGKDALSWGRFPDACPGGDLSKPGCAPGNLTVDQIRGIFNCTEPGGVPLYTNWIQVGGDDEPIVRFLPQRGSGTVSFFETKILGLSSAQQGVLDDTACAVRPTYLQEHDATGVPAAQKSKAILAFGFAKWTQMVNNLSPDLRAGVKLGKINSVKASTQTISDNTFFGTRYIYNVTKTSSPSFNDVLRFVGVDATGNGYICSGAESNNLILYGETPLTFAPAGPGLPNSYCRKNPTPI